MMQKTLTIIGLLALTVHGALGININLTNLPPFYVDDSKDQGCIKTVSNARSACPTCTSKGMPDWWVSEPYINLWVSVRLPDFPG